MAAPDDDRDALTWEGDEVDAVLESETEADRDVDESDDQPSAAAPGTRDDATRRLVAGLLLAAAIASAVGWVLVVVRNPVDDSSMTLLGLAMYQLGELLAIAAAPLWWLLAGRLAERPLAWRLAGLGVTAPWPLIVGWSLA